MKKSATLLLITLVAFAQPNQTEQKKLKTGLLPEDWKYALARHDRGKTPFEKLSR